ncbi:MAG: SDR family oxidoreductase [Chloroflexaceae bacterium]|nr:SDR family oxidoreductase [Chloroflexaceae bacterium]
MRRLLITGGTGYLGTELVRQSQESGGVVAASYSSRPPSVDAPPEVHWLPLDVGDGAAVDEGVAMFRPDTIIHTAFRQHDPGLWEVTAGGTRNVARAAQSLGARLIHLSSDVIFRGETGRGETGGDGTEPRPVPYAAYTEADPPDPMTTYGAAKADAERFVQEWCTNAVVVRTSLIYGVRSLDRHTRFVLDIAEGVRPGVLFHDEFRCPIFVEDLAAALLELVAHSYRGVLHVAGAEPVSRYEFGVLLAQAYGRDTDRIPLGWSRESAEPRPRNCTLDIGLARSLLRTPLRGVREVLAQEMVRATDGKVRENQG